MTSRAFMDYYLFEGSFKGWFQEPHDPEEFRVKAMNMLLIEKGFTMADVENIVKPDFIQYDQFGWRDVSKQFLSF